MRANLRSSGDPRALQWTVEALAQAQELRVSAGRRILEALPEASSSAGAADSVLAAIGRGEETGPSPALARAYRRNREQEEEMERILENLLQEHPAWEWLSAVPGVEIEEAGRLLARLDASRAPTPSAFWAYCGLGTVPGVRHRCSVCGLERTMAESTRTPATHEAPGTRTVCAGRLRAIPSAPAGRVAQPRPDAGERPPYDQEAKKICYRIALGLREAAHQYESYYLEQREALDVSRPAWPSARKHMTALRKMEKLFLAHLWLVWREAQGLPITRPSPDSRADERWSSPWAMIAAPRRRWSRRDRDLPQLRLPG
jgi:hypothetical protein